VGFFGEDFDRFLLSGAIEAQSFDKCNSLGVPPTTGTVTHSSGVRQLRIGGLKRFG
jgi:hypothetical protein